jgi:hypothetical protein
MKKPLLITALIFALNPTNGLAQGTVNFSNRVTAAGVDASVFSIDTLLLGPDAYAWKPRWQQFLLRQDQTSKLA